MLSLLRGSDNVEPLLRTRLRRLNLRRMANVNEIANDLKIAGVVGEKGHAVNVCGGSDYEIDCAASRLTAPVSHGG